MTYRRRFLALLLLFCLPLQAEALTIEEAYKEIPQRQTQYDRSQSPLKASDSGYLQKLFALTDRAVVDRVLVLQWFGSSGAKGESFANYERQTEQVLQELDMLPTPVELREAQTRIAEALQAQKEFFTLWHKAKMSGNGAQFGGAARRSPHRLLLESSKKIRDAFQQLKEFGEESKHNRQAFHDHLSALALVVIH